MITVSVRPSIHLRIEIHVLSTSERTFSAEYLINAIVQAQPDLHWMELKLVEDQIMPELGWQIVELWDNNPIPAV